VDVCFTRRDVHFCGGGRAQGVVGVGEGRAFRLECCTFHFVAAPIRGSESDFLVIIGLVSTY